MDEPGTAGSQHDLAGSYPYACADASSSCAAAKDLDAFRQAAADAAAVDLDLSGRGRLNAPASMVPFVVQSGRSIYLLACENGIWVLAELNFDDERVTFMETRRATYQWPREAFGALLSRVAAREVDDAAVEEVAQDFHRWLGGQFVGD